MKKILSLSLIFFTSLLFSQTGTPDQFTVLEGGTHTGTLQGEAGSNSEGEAHSQKKFSIQSEPKFGTLDYDENTGAFTYVSSGIETTSDFFNFTVKAMDGSTEVESDAVRVSITITPVNDAPVVSTVPVTKALNEGSSIDFSVSGTDLEGDALEYVLKSAPTNGSYVINKYTGAGTYRHGGGESVSDSLKVSVKESATTQKLSSDITVVFTITNSNDAPVAKNAEITVNEGDTSQPFTLSGTDAEVAYSSQYGIPTSQALTYAITSTPSNGETEQVTDSITNSKINSWTYKHNGTETTTDIIEFTVSDGELSSAGQISVVISPVNDKPLPKVDEYSMTKSVNSTTNAFIQPSLVVPAETGLLSNDLDVDSAFANLKASLVTSNNTDENSQLAKYGDVVVNEDGSFVYTLKTNATIPSNTNGDKFYYVVTDDGNSVSEATEVTINFANLFAQPKYYTVEEGSETTITADNGLLVNAFDQNGLKLKAVVDQSPSNGTLVVNEDDGQFVYTHDGSDNRIDTFTYYVLNANEDKSTSTYVIIKNTNVNDAPTATDSTISLDEGATLTFTPNYTDIDNDLAEIVFSITDIAANPVSNGVLTNNNNGTLTYKHDGSEVTTDKFTYTVSDGLLQSNLVTQNIAITSVNDAPVASSSTVNIDEGSTKTITPLGLDAEGGTLEFYLVSQPDYGDVTVNTDGTFTYVSDGSEVSADEFEFNVSDGSKSGDPAKISFTINPVDDKPTVMNVDPIPIDEGASTTIGLKNYGADAEGASVSFLVEELPDYGYIDVDSNNDGNYDKRLEANDMPFAANNVTYVNDGSQNSDDSFAVRSFTGDSIPLTQDGGLDMSSANLSEKSKIGFSITNLNDAPALSDKELAVNRYDEIKFSIPVVDEEGNALTYSVVSTVSKGELTLRDASENSFIYENLSETDIEVGAFEEDKFTVSVTDGTTASEREYTIKINGIDETLPQIILTTTTSSITETSDGSNTITINASLVGADFYSEKRDMDNANSTPNVDFEATGVYTRTYRYIGEYKGHRYYHGRHGLNWDDANKEAEALGGYLVSFEDAEEFVAINDLLHEQDGNGESWIGLKYNFEKTVDDGTSGVDQNKWEWSNKNNGGYFPWSEGTWNKDVSPAGSTNLANKFAYLEVRTPSGRSGAKNDRSKEDGMRYIVEFDNNVKPENDITFDLLVDGGTAKEGSDFSINSKALTIAANTSSTTAIITETADTLDESAEEIIISATNASTNSIIKQSTNELVIAVLDDEKTTVTLTPSSSTVNEAIGEMTLTAAIANSKASDITLSLDVTGSATLDKDYIIPNNSYIETIKTSNGSVLQSKTKGDNVMDGFEYPRAMAQATDGTYIVASTYRLYKVSSDGTVERMSNVNGNRDCGDPSSSTNIVYDLSFCNIETMVIDKRSNRSVSGNDDVVYFVDHDRLIYKWDLGTNGVSLVTGSRQWQDNFGNGSLEDARFNHVRDIAVSSDHNNLYVIDRNAIRKIDLVNEEVSTLAGNRDWGWEDGSLSSARFEGPEGLALDSNGDIIVRQHGSLRKIDIANDMVSTLVRTDWNSGDLAIDSSDNVYFGTHRSKLYSYSSDGDLSLIIDSENSVGSLDGPVSEAQIERPRELIVNNSGYLTFIEEKNNGSIRFVDPSQKLRIKAGETQVVLNFKINDDTIYENDETIGFAITDANLVDGFDTVSQTITIDGQNAELTGYDAKPEVNVTASTINVSESSSGANSTILTFQLGDASESGARMDMSEGLKGDYYYMGTVGSHKYYMSYNQERWIDADKIAKEIGGYLVVVDDAQENQWLRDNVDQDYRWESFWIGYDDADVEGDFVWANGSDSTYENWNNGEPNNAGNEDYTELLNNGKWNDLPNHHRRFIVEFSGTISSLPTQLTYTIEGSTDQFTYSTIAENGARTAFDVNSIAPISIAAGKSKKEIEITAVDDTVDEGSDSINVKITSPGDNGTIGSKDQVAVSISDDDLPTAALVPPADLTFNENNGTLQISASVGNVKPFATTLDVTFNRDGSDTAIYGEDYQVVELSTVTTLSGSGSSGYLDGNKDVSKFDRPHGMALDSQGNLYVADRENQLIRKVDKAGNVTTFAGNGNWSHDRLEGNALEVGIVHPRALAFDSNGNLFVGETGRNRISKIDTNGYVTHVIGQGDHGDNDGGKNDAQFDYISAIAFDSSGNLIVLDAGAEKVKKVIFEPGTGAANVTTLAGSGSHEYADGPGSDAAFRHPYGLVIDANDNIYVADQHNHRIRLVKPDGTVSTFAGDGWGDQDGSLANARFRQPTGITMDANGDLYIAEREGPRIRFIDVSEGTVTTLAGAVDAYGHVDGSFETARFKRPISIISNASALFISDEESHRIRQIKLKPSITIPAGSLTGSLTLSGIDDYVFENAESVTMNVTDVSGATNLVADFETVVATLNSDDALPVAKISFPDDYLHEEGAQSVNIAVTLTDIYSSPLTDMPQSNKAEYYYLGEHNGSKYYASIDGHYRYSEAKKYAEELGGQLAIISSPAEQEAIVNGLFDADSRYQKDDNRWLNHWIGYEYSDDDVWGWSNNLPSGFENWRDDWQKNQHANREAAWLHMDGMWHSSRASDHRRYIIEYSSAISDADTNIGIAYNDSASTGITLYGDGADFTSNLIGEDLDNGIAGVLTIPKGSPSANLVLTAVDDNENESIETFVVALAYAQGATISADDPNNNTVGVAVNDNEKPVVTLSINDNLTEISEKDGKAAIIATVDQTKLFPVSVDLQFNSGELIADFGNDYDSKDLNSVSDWVGVGRNGYVDGDFDEAEFSHRVSDMVTDADGNIYVADNDNHVIRKIDIDGNVSTYAGGGNDCCWEGSRDKLSIELHHPAGLAIDQFGNMFISNEHWHNIIKITPDGQATTFANNRRENGRSNGDGNILDANFEYPIDLVFDSNGNLFVLERGSIRKITISGDIASVSDFVGNGDGGFEDGLGTEARFDHVDNLAIDSFDNIFFADRHHNRIRMVTPDGMVSTVAGTGNWGYIDGLGNNASFREPRYVTLDSNNNLLVGDLENNRIRKVEFNRDEKGAILNSRVSTLAGNGNYGTVNGTADVAEFKKIETLLVQNGVLYIYDRDESMFRQLKLNPVMNIPAGVNNAIFEIAAIDDTVYESTETISITPIVRNATLAIDESISLLITSDEQTPKVRLGSVDKVVPENGASIPIYVGLEDASGQAAVWENYELPADQLGSYDFMGEFNGHKYYFSRFRQNFFDAYNTAQSVGGQLLVIETQEENDYISTIMIHDGTWLGHFRSSMDNPWINIYGNSEFTNYEIPSDFSDFYGYAVTYGQGWYNENGLIDKHFIIEYGPVTTSELTSQVKLVMSGTAENGVDYFLSTETAVIQAGSTEVKIDLEGINDELDEPIETINITLELISDAEGNSISNVNLGDQISLEIELEDDEVPVVDYAIDNTEIAENGGKTILTASLSNAKLYPTTINLDLGGDSEALLDYNVSSIFNYEPFVGAYDQRGFSRGYGENAQFDDITHLNVYKTFLYPDGYYANNMLATDHNSHVIRYINADGQYSGYASGAWLGQQFNCGNPLDKVNGDENIRICDPAEVAQFQGIAAYDEESQRYYAERPSLTFWYQHNRIYVYESVNDTTTIFYDGGINNDIHEVSGIEAVERNGKLELYFTDFYNHTLNKFTYVGNGQSYDVSNWTMSQVAGNKGQRGPEVWSHTDNDGIVYTQGFSFSEASFFHPSTLAYDSKNDRIIVSTGRHRDDWWEKSNVMIVDFSEERIYPLGIRHYLRNASGGDHPRFGQLDVDKNGSLFIPINNYNIVVKVDFAEKDGYPIYGSDFVSKVIANERISNPSSVLVNNGYAYVANRGSAVIDKINLSANISIPAGETSGTITFDAFKDPFFEDNETIAIGINSIANGYSVDIDADGNPQEKTAITDVTIVEATRLTLVEEAPFQGVENGKVSWGDYDQDGDMDVAVMGQSDVGTITSIFNNNNGKFEPTNFNFTKFIGGDIEFVDVNQDGWLDIAVSGNAEGNVRKAELYINEEGNNFLPMDDFQVEGLSQCDMEWGDLDNDGDPDLVISGINSNNQFRTHYYTNLGDFRFLQEFLFQDDGVIGGEIDIVDADQDGDNDLFTNGNSGNPSDLRFHTNRFINTYYRDSYDEEGQKDTHHNHHDGFNVTSGFKNGNTVYSDIDGDGSLDFLSIGEDGQGQIRLSSNLGALYNLPPLMNVDFDFADYNNDGQSDLIIAGEDPFTNAAVTKLYTSYPNYFGATYGVFESDLEIQGLRESSVDWIDYDLDGDLDLFITGLDDQGIARAKLYKAENTYNLNTAPEKVTNFKAETDQFGGVEFTWDKPKDNSSTEFRYSLRVGTTPGGNDVIYSNSNDGTSDATRNGQRLINVPSLSTLNERELSLDPGTYYASVQAIDGGNMGGPFSDEIEFTLDYEWKYVNLGGVIDRRLVPSASTQLEFVDMDGDGDQDLISTNVGMVPNRNQEWRMQIQKSAINIYKNENDVFVPAYNPWMGFGYWDGTSTFDFGDFNQDGYIDLIVAIEESQGTRIEILLNTRAADDAREDNPNSLDFDESTFRTYFMPYNPFPNGDNFLPNIFDIKFAIKDLNQDGLLEVIAAGQSSKLSSEAITMIIMKSVTEITKENRDWDGLSIDINGFKFNNREEDQKIVDESYLNNLSFASYDFGDFDGDSDFDFLISGYSFDGYKTYLFENNTLRDENGVVVTPVQVEYKPIDNSFVSVKEGTANFVDFDSDGDSDVLFTGQSKDGDLVKAYLNSKTDNNVVDWTEFDVGLPAIRDGRFKFIDFDSDGLKDAIYSGTISGEGKITRLAAWDGGLQVMMDENKYDISVFEDANIGYGDFDGDLDSDIVITGRNKFVTDINNPYLYIADVFMNVRGFAGPGDDADGGIVNNGTGENWITGPLKKSVGTKKVYGYNSRPNPPTEVNFQRSRLGAFNPNDDSGYKTSSRNGSSDGSSDEALFELVISWSGAVDTDSNGNVTPPEGLTYSIRIGTTPGGSEIMAPGADVDGVKATADAGNAENNLSWKVNVPMGTYYVAVQSIDASYIGSPFSDEKEYTVTSAFKLGDANGDDGVNILDLTTLVDKILKNNPKVFVQEVADINNDGEINVVDISAIVNIIMNDASGVARGADYDPYDWEYYSDKPVGNATLVHTDGRIYLENDKPVTSLQFSMDATVDYELSEELENLTVVNFVENGKRSFLIYSYDNQPIDELTNVVFDYIDVLEGDEFEITDMRSGTRDGLVLDLRYSDERFFDSLEDSIRMYPNPADSNVNLLTKVTEDVETLDVNIYNVLGVSVYNTTIDSMGRLNDLDVSMLASGLYTVQVRMITKGNEEIISVHKLIKK